MTLVFVYSSFGTKSTCNCQFVLCMEEVTHSKPFFICKLQLWPMTKLWLQTLMKLKGPSFFSFFFFCFLRLIWIFLIFLHFIIRINGWPKIQLSRLDSFCTHYSTVYIGKHFSLQLINFFWLAESGDSCINMNLIYAFF